MADRKPSEVEQPAKPGSANEADCEKTRFEKELDLWAEAQKQIWTDAAAKVATQVAHEAALKAAETASRAAVQAAYITSTQASLERSLTRTNVLTASVGTIITLYTGLLAFIYTNAETATGGKTGVTIHPLQPVALVPPLFLAISLLLATVYAVVLRNGTRPGRLLPSGIGGDVMENRLRAYMLWCFEPMLARRWALNAGIASLAVGIATLPLPFTKTSATFHFFVVLSGAVLVVLAGALSLSRPNLSANAPELPAGVAEQA